MADDLEKKMDPEIKEATEVAEEIKETASAVEAVEERAIAEVEEKAVAEVEEKAAEVATVAAADADASEKAAKKAEELAAKEAAKKKAAIEKEEEKARIAKEKATAKIEKKHKKLAAQQALIDACPPQYRPVSTSKYFWLGFLSFLPVVGVILTVIFAIIGRNRNVKNFEKAILAYYIIALIIFLIALIVVGVVLPPDVRENVLSSLRTIFGSIKIG